MLSVSSKRWLVTGAAGFIGSHIVESLLSLGATVKGFDTLESGNLSNLEEVQAHTSVDDWSRFTLIQGDIRREADCRQACEDIDVIIHLAAVSSVPDSIKHPYVTSTVNVGGFINVLHAAKEAGVKRFVYASSCSVYGNEPSLPKRENSPLCPLTPYALSKQVNELYAMMYGQSYGLETVGLRYFNVYGTRQQAHGTCAGVVPIWFDALSRDAAIFINGNGETTRDFCHVSDVARANLLAGMIESKDALNQVYNIGSGRQISLNHLTEVMASTIRKVRPDMPIHPKVVYRGFRAGDITHSLADITKAQRLLKFKPETGLEDGLLEIAAYYLRSADPVALR